VLSRILVLERPSLDYFSISTHGIRAHCKENRFLNLIAHKFSQKLTFFEALYVFENSNAHWLQNCIYSFLVVIPINKSSE
jgi:hypothetical protein